MRSDRDKFARRLDRLVERHEGRVEHADLEHLLQIAAQRQRKKVMGSIPLEDIEGWSE